MYVCTWSLTYIRVHVLTGPRTHLRTSSCESVPLAGEPFVYGDRNLITDVHAGVDAAPVKPLHQRQVGGYVDLESLTCY